MILSTNDLDQRSEEIRSNPTDWNKGLASFNFVRLNSITTKTLKASHQILHTNLVVVLTVK